MKTLAQIAEECGQPRQYAYDAVKELGMSLDSITVKKQGNKRLVSEQAEKSVKEYLLNKHDSDCKKQDCKQTVNDSATVAKEGVSELQQVKDSLTAQINDLKQKLKNAEAKAVEQERAAAAFKEQLDRAEETLHEKDELIAEQKKRLEKDEEVLDETRHQVSVLVKHVNVLQEHLDEANGKLKLLMPAVEENTETKKEEQPKESKQVSKKIGFWSRIFRRGE